jgi:hypothetical protein
MVWESEATRLLKAELARRGLTYLKLAERFREKGVDETTSSISNKISRGSFSFAFFLQCMWVLGDKEPRLRIFSDPSPGPALRPQPRKHPDVLREEQARADAAQHEYDAYWGYDGGEDDRLRAAKDKAAKPADE